ncbi:GLE1-like protein-domain-containing protein [Calycina marina]|uniref:mRNA export factor GLE1 n=1 Tax=Calycina marina TaxID=1763456 RepID=A0A9P8CFV6_9HELO|nr:GLE1-like protein-domain-containing protein [Calycina marina]
MAASQSIGIDGALASSLHHTHISNDLFTIVNSQEVHERALSEAYAYHNNLRETAIEALRLSEAREAVALLRAKAKAEEEKLRVEYELANEACRIRDLENKARLIPKPAPRVPTPPPVELPKTPVPPVDQQTPPPPSPAIPADTSTSQPPQMSTQQPQPAHIPPIPIPPPKSCTDQRANPGGKADHTVEAAARYVEIHKSLKQLRAWLQDTVFPSNQAWAKLANEARRNVRTACGQLSTDRTKNRAPALKVMEELKKSLEDQSGILVDPGNYMVTKPEPREGAANNGEKLPAVFIWLLNYLAKAIVNQCVNELADRFGQADPVGVFVATIFSHSPIFWREEPMIDILMAKFRIACPALFGLRGNEKTDQGRARLGWKNLEGRWYTEEGHMTRMKGIAIGYAAISLRDFSRTKFKNPWPPSNYWASLSSILNTPGNEASKTQIAVLEAMIRGFTTKFIGFYGTAGLAALKLALIDFPAKVIRDNPIPEEDETKKNADAGQHISVVAEGLKSIDAQLRKEDNLVLDARSGIW